MKLDGFQLKVLAMCAMTTDHIAWLFHKELTAYSELLHFIGRLVAPLMCYFLAMGFFRTRDVKSYATRLLGFAVISQPAYAWFQQANHYPYQESYFYHLFAHFNILFGLFLSLVNLWVWRGSHANKRSLWVKITTSVMLAPLYFWVDYGLATLLWTFLFSMLWFFDKNEAEYYEDVKPTITILFISTALFAYLLSYGFRMTPSWNGMMLMHFGVLLVAGLIWMDNGKKGSSFGGRYLFYWFYPVHLIVLSMLFFITH